MNALTAQHLAHAYPATTRSTVSHARDENDDRRRMRRSWSRRLARSREGDDLKAGSQAPAAEEHMVDVLV
jgi:hypothetical protein